MSEFCELLSNLDRLHTTALGAERIRRNAAPGAEDTVAWCREKIAKSGDITRAGKNWYVCVDGVVITVNASSYAVITAHEVR